jgi:NADH pyrophosphatase-like rudimentary NUDIX domain
LSYLTYGDVKEYINNPYVLPEDERLRTYNSKEHQPEPTLVFLGIDEASKLPISDLPGHEMASKYPGEAYFSIDVTPENQSEKYKQRAQDIVDRAKEKGLEFLTVRLGVALSESEAPIVGLARSFTDWNLRNVVSALFLMEIVTSSIVLLVEDARV